MIAPLRARHRATFVVLAVVLPAAFAWALAARDDERGASDLPRVIVDDGPELGQVRATRTVFHDGRTFVVELGTEPRVIALAQRSGELAPDVLAYWCASVPSSSELPTEAVLLGALGNRPRRFALPAAASAKPGAVVLFSLAHFEVVASVPLEP